MADVEEWRPVLAYEGLYEVSSLGRVRSLDRAVDLLDSSERPYQRRSYTGQILRTSAHKAGYPQVKLSNSGRVRLHFVHVLVCTAFHGPRPHNLEVAHGDGNPANNLKTNLRWATRSSNQMDAIAHGRRGGNLNWNARLTPEIVQAIRREHIEGARQIDLAAKYNVGPVAVHDAIRRRTWAWVM